MGKDFSVIQAAASLIGVLGLIILMFVGLKMLNKRVSVIGGSRLRILDRANIGRDSVILIVSVCGKLMLIGVSSQRIEKLADLDVTEEEYSASEKNGNLSGSVPAFSDVLNGFLNKKKRDNNASDNLEDFDKSVNEIVNSVIETSEDNSGENSEKTLNETINKETIREEKNEGND